MRATATKPAIERRQGEGERHQGGGGREGNVDGGHDAGRLTVTGIDPPGWRESALGGRVRTS